MFSVTKNIVYIRHAYSWFWRYTTLPVFQLSLALLAADYMDQVCSLNLNVETSDFLI